MSGHAAGFEPRAMSPGLDERLDAPAFHRNHEPIWAVLLHYLQAKKLDVLEIGSGTGQHAVAFARQAPAIVWWPTDYDEAHLRSIAGWRAQSRLANLGAPIRLDASSTEWWSAITSGERPRAYGAMFCANVLHISPWRVSQGLFNGATRVLNEDGRLFLYGPFMRDGTHTAPSNAVFDRSLRERNSEWGVRDIGDLVGLAEAVGLALADTHEMPANNLLLVFARSSAPGFKRI